MEHGDIGGGHKGHFAPAGKGLQPDGEAGKWTAAGLAVLEDLEGLWEPGQWLTRRANEDDRSLDAAGDDAGDPSHQRRAVPLQECLRGAHPGGDTADEDDPDAAMHTNQATRARPLPRLRGAASGKARLLGERVPGSVLGEDAVS